MPISDMPITSEQKFHKAMMLTQIETAKQVPGNTNDSTAKTISNGFLKNLITFLMNLFGIKSADAYQNIPDPSSNSEFNAALQLIEEGLEKQLWSRETIKESGGKPILDYLDKKNLDMGKEKKFNTLTNNQSEDQDEFFNPDCVVAYDCKDNSEAIDKAYGFAGHDPFLGNPMESNHFASVAITNGNKLITTVINNRGNTDDFNSIGTAVNAINTTNSQCCAYVNLTCYNMKSSNFCEEQLKKVAMSNLPNTTEVQIHRHGNAFTGDDARIEYTTIGKLRMKYKVGQYGKITASGFQKIANAMLSHFEIKTEEEYKNSKDFLETLCKQYGFSDIQYPEFNDQNTKTKKVDDGPAYTAI
jgi:hypothetical protein